MNGPLPGVRATAQPAGLIDTVQAGFDLVNHNAWLLLIPIFIDLVLWLGPQVTVGNLAEDWISEFAALAPPSPEMGATAEERRQSLLALVHQADGLSRYNLVSFLSIPLLGLPSFQAGTPGRGALVPIESAMTGAILVVVLTAAGLGLAALFYGMLGQAVRDGHASPTTFASALPDTLVRLGGLFGLVLVVVIGVGLPVGGMLALASAAAPTVGSVLAALLLGMLMWGFVYLFFATDALYVSSLSPIAAVRSSIRVVRENFWSSLGIIGLIVVISWGLTILWSGISQSLHTPGTALAIFGHIYISTGLAAASMTYYKDRFDRILTAHNGQSGVAGG